MKMTPKFLRLLGHEIVVCFIFFASFIPIYGVWKWSWQVSEIVFLYGAETMIIALFAIAKMLTARVPDDEDGYGLLSVFANLAAFAGLLTASAIPVFLLNEVFYIERHLRAFEWDSGLGLAVTGLLGSYFSMFIFDWVFSGRFTKSQSSDAMGKPLARIFFGLMFAFIGGGLTKLFGQPMIALVILCVCKALWDVLSYLLRNFGSLKVDGEYVYGGPEDDTGPIDRVYAQTESSAEKDAGALVQELDEIRRRVKPKI